MKRKITIIIIIILFCFLIWLFFFLLIQNKYEISELKMDVVIGNYTGINLDTDAVHFGTIEKGKATTRTREVVITNNHDKSKKIYITTSGKLSKWVELSEDSFILSPQENKSVQVMLKINPEIDYGTYNGTLKAEFKEEG